MVVSILHRATGAALSLAGLALLAWWLFALGSTDGYAKFEGFIGWTAFHVPWVKLILIGITWSFFQHLLSGIRHLAMDTGAAFELGINRTFAIMTIVGSVLLTALVWLYLFGVAK
jgi:succinate dehydrogenase / fumarate reductase cytochrome b subunit